MGLTQDGDGVRLFRAGTANDRLKAGHRAVLHRSIIASVLIHAALILAWPEPDPHTFTAGGSSGSDPLQLVALASDADPGSDHGFAPTYVEEAAVREALADPGASAEGVSTAGGEAAPEGWEARSEDLWRLAALRPRVVDRPRETVEEGGGQVVDSTAAPSDGTEREGLRIRLDASELEYQRLSEEEMLSLERLSALRPELVLSSPSNWLIVRNPSEVGAFMQERFDQYGVEAGVRGSFAVSLWVDERGSVEWAEINRSSGDPRLDASALEMFRSVVAFRPAREEGMRVPVAAVFWLTW